MTKKRLLELIDEGENLKIEFKQRFSTHEKIAKEMIALANTRGGYLIFGIDDDGSIYGVESEKGEAELVKETAEKYCEPPVKIEMSYFELEAKEIVLVEIKESINKPHRLQDYSDKLDPSAASVYIRINDKSVLASKEMIKILQAQSSGLSLKNYFVGKIEKSVFEFYLCGEVKNIIFYYQKFFVNQISLCRRPLPHSKTALFQTEEFR